MKGRATWSRPPPCSFVVAAVVLWLMSSVADHPTAQDRSDCDRLPYTLAEVETLVGNSAIPAGYVRGELERCGISFILDADGEQRLRDLGAADDLVALLAPPADPTPGARWTPPVDGREMAWIPAGLYFMGSPVSEEGHEGDETQHGVQVDRGFWLDVAEVTNEAYRRFILANPEWSKSAIAAQAQGGDYLREWTGNDFPEGLAEAPVVNVSWRAARAYASWAGKRLPTEAEWEYAARAGSSTAYWWGDAFDARRVAPDLSGAPAPETRRSPWGQIDMIGGVWEWTSTLAAPFTYPYRAGDGREDPDAAGPRVIRGGYWGSAPRFLRVANRGAEQPATTVDTLGFRCAR